MKKRVKKQIDDNDITFYKEGKDKFFQVGKHIVVKRYFLPANEFTTGVTKEEGFCIVLATKKDEKRFLKICDRNDLEVFRVDMTYLDDFVENEMKDYTVFNFSDKPDKELNILHKKCHGRKED